MDIDALIDQFVEKVNRKYREPKTENEVPVNLRIREVNPGWYDWFVKRSQSINWINDIESRLPCRLPRSFQSLLSRYEYPAFEADPLVLLANIAEGTEYELRMEIFADSSLSSFLLKNGLIQFAKPSGWQYDPVCFDARKKVHRREFPIVRIDHEEILCNNQIRIIETVAFSFYEFVLEYITSETKCSA